MAQKTSINIKPCNIGSSEAHNKKNSRIPRSYQQKRGFMSVLTLWLQTKYG